MVVLIWENGGLGGWFWGWLVHPRRCLVAPPSSRANWPAAAPPPRPAPRTITVWGPATPRVRRWFLNALPANNTYVDVKPSNAIESAVIGAYVATRPLYARLFP